MRALFVRSSLAPPLLAGLLAAAALGGCDRPTQRAAQRPSVPAAAAVAKGVIDVDGGLVRLSSPRDGVLTSVRVHEGDHVEKGAVMATLDDAQAKLNLEGAVAEEGDKRAQAVIAQAKAAAAQRDADRLGRLSKADAATRQDAEQAQVAAKVAAAERDQAEQAVQAASVQRRLAELEVQQRTLRAPAAGTVVRRTAVGGVSVSAGSPVLFTVAPDGPRVVRAELDEAFADRVQPGMPATVVREFNEHKTYKAKVLRISEVFGSAALNDEPGGRADARVLSVVLQVEPTEDLRLGQRVLVRFGP